MSPLPGFDAGELTARERIGVVARALLVVAVNPAFVWGFLEGSARLGHPLPDVIFVGLLITSIVVVQTAIFTYDEGVRWRAVLTSAGVGALGTVAGWIALLITRG